MVCEEMSAFCTESKTEMKTEGGKSEENLLLLKHFFKYNFLVEPDVIFSH